MTSSVEVDTLKCPDCNATMRLIRRRLLLWPSLAIPLTARGDARRLVE
jgi:hypothetical protein